MYISSGIVTTLVVLFVLRKRNHPDESFVDMIKSMAPSKSSQDSSIQLVSKNTELESGITTTASIAMDNMLDSSNLEEVLYLCCSCCCSSFFLLYCLLFVVCCLLLFLLFVVIVVVLVVVVIVIVVVRML